MRNTLSRVFDVAYLGLFPIEHKSEGLNVLLCDTIRPLMNQGVTVRIHTTGRHATAVKKALEGNGVDMKRVEIFAYRVESITLVLQHLLNRVLMGRKPSSDKPGLLGRLRTWIMQTGKSSIIGLTNWLLDLTIWNFLPKLIVFLALGIILALTAATGLTVLSLLSTIAVATLLVQRILGRLLARVRTKASQRPALREMLLQWRRTYRAQKSAFIQHVHGHVYAREQERFARAVNRNSRVKRLFFFSAFDGHAVAHFKGASLAVFPDGVTMLFPLRFIGAHNAPVLEELRLTVANADALVCYSNYVRNQQLMRLFPAETGGKRIEVIPQGYFPIAEEALPQKSAVGRELNAHRSLLINCFPTLLLRPPAVDFTQFDFILYPTIDRPHKNSLTLVRAYEKLLRKRHRNVKLILTSPAPSRDVADYITERRLQYDVLYMPSVPINVLNLLFKGAVLMVHPSLAEGGDIFNFSRAAAAGAPALLADVPVVREMFERGGLNRETYASWVFDPMNAASLADRIDDVLTNPGPIVAAQQAATRELSHYGFQEMANRYLQLYESL